MTETQSNGYSSESTKRELSNEYQHAQGLDGFQKSSHPCSMDEISLSIGRVKGLLDLSPSNAKAIFI